MHKKILAIASGILLLWILSDLYWPRKVNIREFNPAETARLDGDMWRSYYERKPVLLFWQSGRLMRKQLQAPFWRSFAMAYHAAKAAFVFKDGKNRSDYRKALPNLKKYYGLIYALSDTPFDVGQAAQKELEWWIIRRERDRHPPEEWARLQAEIAGQLYNRPASEFEEYGRLRTEAMLYRDLKGEAITEQDWQKIQALLLKAWTSQKEKAVAQPGD